MKVLKKIFLMVGIVLLFRNGFGLAITESDVKIARDMRIERVLDTTTAERAYVKMARDMRIERGLDTTYLLPDVVFLYDLYSSVRKNDAVFVQLVKERAHKDGKSIEEYKKLLDQNNEHLQKRLNEYSYKSLFFDKQIAGYGALFMGGLVIGSLTSILANQLTLPGLVSDEELKSWREEMSSGRAARKGQVSWFGQVFGKKDNYWLSKYDELADVLNKEYEVAAPFSWYRMLNEAALIQYGMSTLPFMYSVSTKYNYIKMSRGIIFDLIKTGEIMLDLLKSEVR